MAAFLLLSSLLFLSLLGGALSQERIYLVPGENWTMACTDTMSADWRLLRNSVSTNVSDRIHQVRESAMKSTIVLQQYTESTDRNVVYHCFRVQSNPDTLRFQLQNAVPVTGFSRMPESGTFNESTTGMYTLRCSPNVEAEPQLDIANWNVQYRNGSTTKIIGKNNLPVTLDRQSAGNYTCELSNKAGPTDPLRQTAEIVINYMPDATITVPTNNSIFRSTQREGIKVECNILAFPQVQSVVLYFTNGTTPRTQIHTQMGSTLAWTPSGRVWQRSDTGTYSCEASNFLGTGNTEISISVIAPPGAVANLTSDSNATSTSANLTWSAPTDNGGEEVTMYFVNCVTTLAMSRTHNSSITTSSTAALVTDLLSGQEYTCSVSAGNRAGFGPAQSLTTMTAPGSPCTPVLMLISQSHRNVCLSWRVDCNGGADLMQCQLRRQIGSTSPTTIQTIPGTETRCSADGNSYTSCDTSSSLDPQTVYAYTFFINNNIATSTSSALQAQPTDTIVTTPTAGPTTTTGGMTTAGATITPKASSDGGLSTGAIVGIVVGCILAVAVVIIIIIIVVRQGGSGGGDKKSGIDTVRYTRPPTSGDEGDGSKPKSELNYANVQITPGSGKSTVRTPAEQTTYASIDKDKTMAQARGGADEAGGTSTVV